jgi:hypothetical protein
VVPAGDAPPAGAPPLPSNGDLAAAARHCPPLERAHRLAAWVGESRPVTTAGVLGAPAAAVAIQMLGLRPPLDDPELDARQEAMFLVPDRDTGDQARRSTELSKVWDLAIDVDFLEVCDDTVRPGPGMCRWPRGEAAEVLEVWAAGLASATRRAYDHEPVRLPERLCLGTLPALDPLYGADSVALTDLRAGLARRAAHDGLTEELRTWTERYGDPLSPLLGCLSEFGAIALSGDRAGLTPLGTWAWRTLAADA